MAALKNKLGIIDSTELAREEERISKRRAAGLFESGLLDALKPGSYSALQTIHKYLFSDIYEFAGQTRTVNLAKGNFRFAPVMYLDAALESIEKMPQSTFDEIIEKYGLSLVSKNGYDYYGCESSKGLGDYNREGYLKLRADFNQKYANGNFDYYYYVMLYVIIVYAFNNQIRFNSNGEFNLPVGKRDFNKKMEQKLIDFIDKIQSQNCIFTCCDFRAFDTSALTLQDFVYVDPPYLITCATYNEQGGWSEDDEKDLLAFLDELNGRNIRFSLSNVLRSKGKENNILIEWLNKNADKYKTVRLNYSYSNSNYQTKDKSSSSEEVLIINY